MILGLFTALADSMWSGDALHTAQKSTCDKIHPAVWLHSRPPFFFWTCFRARDPTSCTTAIRNPQPACFTSRLRIVGISPSTSTTLPWLQQIATMADSELQVSQTDARTGQRPTAATSTIRVAN